MKGAWVAGGVRARLLAAERRLGRDGAMRVATSGSLPAALVLLAESPYRRGVRLDLDLAGAQRAIAATTLFHLRLIAGWLPREAIPPLRSLAAWFELANLEDRLAYLSGGPLSQPFELGSLAVAWPRAALAGTPDELVAVAAGSAWGDPRGSTLAERRLGLRLAWARRVLADVPEARAWASGALALVVARELYVVGRPVEHLSARPIPALGPHWHRAVTFDRFAASLPAHAAWALAGIASPRELWRAEARWWARVEADASALLRGELSGRPLVVGVTALLAADGWRTSAALAAAARGGLPGIAEAFDAVA